MLHLIFRGFFEWIYSLLVDIWAFIANGLLSIMSLDFAYLQSHVPIIPQMSRLLLAVGWSLLLGNLVFQALKSMAAGLGFEGEDPKLLFSRTFVFAFLLMASPQICEVGLELTSNIMNLLSLPDATDVELVSEGIFGSMTAAWLLSIICSIIVMVKVLGLVIEVAERYVVLAMLTITAPLAFAMGGSKNTASIFSGWCRMFGSMCLLMVTNLVCCKMLFSVVSTVPSGLDVLPWLVLIFAIVKVAKKSDAIITRIGLNPAITGGPGKTLPGMLAYTVARTAVNHVVKSMGGSGKGGGTSAKAPSRGAAKSGGSFSRFSGKGINSGRHSPQSSGRTDRGYTHQNSRQQDASSQSTSQQTDSRYSSAVRGDSRQTGTHTQQEKTSQTSTQQSPVGGSASRTGTGGGGSGQTRRSSVPPGTRRAPSHVPPTFNTPQAPGAAPAEKPGASAPKWPDTPRPGPAGTTVQMGGAFDAAKAHPGPAGMGTYTQPARSTRITSQTVGGGTVNNSAQTNVTAGRAASDTAAPRQPRPGVSAASTSVPKPDKTHSTKRENTDAAPKTSATPTPGFARPDPAGTAARSTQRPPEPSPRPGRNIPPATVAPPVDRPSSGTIRQEPGRTAAPTSPLLRSGASTVRPGPAETAEVKQRAAAVKRPAAYSSKRVKPARSSPKKGGANHG